MLKPNQEAHRQAVSARFARNRARWDAYKVASILWRRHIAREVLALTGLHVESSQIVEGAVFGNYVVGTMRLRNGDRAEVLRPMEALNG